MQHFNLTTSTGRPIPAAMSHNDLLTLQSNQRLMMPSFLSPTSSSSPPRRPPTSPTTPLPTTILRHIYHIDDADDDADIAAIMAETSFMQPNIATTKVYSDHEINYYSKNTITTPAAGSAAATNTIDNNNINSTMITPITTTTLTPERFEEPIRDTIIGITTAATTDLEHLKQPEQHLYHTL